MVAASTLIIYSQIYLGLARLKIEAHLDHVLAHAHERAEALAEGGGAEPRGEPHRHERGGEVRLRSYRV